MDHGIQYIYVKYEKVSVACPPPCAATLGLYIASLSWYNELNLAWLLVDFLGISYLAV